MPLEDFEKEIERETSGNDWIQNLEKGLRNNPGDAESTKESFSGPPEDPEKRQLYFEALGTKRAWQLLQSLLEAGIVSAGMTAEELLYFLQDRAKKLIQESRED